MLYICICWIYVRDFNARTCTVYFLASVDFWAHDRTNAVHLQRIFYSGVFLYIHTHSHTQLENVDSISWNILKEFSMSRVYFATHYLAPKRYHFWWLRATNLILKISCFGFLIVKCRKTKTLSSLRLSGFWDLN